MWFWIIGLSALFVGPPALIVGASVLISTRRSGRGSTRQTSQPHQIVRRARIGRLAGLGLGALVGAVAFLAGFGLIAPILVAVGYLVGVLVAELRPVTRPAGPIRVASLQARSAWAYLPRWVVPAIVAAAALALIAPILFATVSPPPPNYFGWMLALSVPLTVIAVLAVGGFVLLMARLAALPQPGPPDEGGADRDRANTARAIAGAVLGIELLALGGLAIVASTDAVGPFVTTGLAFVAARILIWSGLGLALTGMLVWAGLSRWRNAPSAPSGPSAPKPSEPTSPGPANPRSTTATLA